MDHFWALIKTLGVVIAWIVGMIAFFLFAALGIPVIGAFFWEYGRLIIFGLCVLALFGMVVLEYFRFLHLEREKREKKIRKDQEIY